MLSFYYSVTLRVCSISTRGSAELSSSISGLSLAQETQAEVLGLRKALEYETLCEGIVGLPEMPETDVHL